MALIGGPLLGSFITEPAAMTVTALLLLDRIFRARISNRFSLCDLGTFVCECVHWRNSDSLRSTSGLMVAPKWGWDLSYIFFTLVGKGGGVLRFNGGGGRVFL